MTLQPDEFKPLWQTGWDKVRQTISKMQLQLVYSCHYLVSVLRQLDPHSCQVLWSHPGDCVEVISSTQEQRSVAVIAKTRQPGTYTLRNYY